MMLSRRKEVFSESMTSLTRKEHGQTCTWKTTRVMQKDAATVVRDENKENTGTVVREK